MLTNVRLLALIILLIVGGGGYCSHSWLESSVRNYIIMPIIKKDTKSLVAEINEHLWDNYNKAITKYGVTALPKGKDYLKKQGNKFLKYSLATKISLYSLDKHLLFASNNTPILFKAESQEQDFNDALRGRAGYIFVPDTKFTQNNKIVEGSMIRVLTPLNNDSPVAAVVEIFYDLKDFKSQMNYIFMIILAVIASIVAVLYVILYFTSRHAEKIIEKQHEINVDLEKAKEEAEEASREKSKFLANVSHELRTPLNAIIGFSDIIKDEVMGPLENVQYKEYILDINGSGIHLLGLINDILDYSKAEAGKLEVDSTPMDLNKIMKNSTRLVLPRAQKSQVELIEEYPKEHIVLNADPKRMKQVILNMLSNSVKFTPEGGKVTVKIYKNMENTHAVIQIVDTGIGISAKNLAKALSAFGQVDSSLSKRYEGTGLGLPFSKRLVNLMDGDFNIQSEEGLGTTVTLTFPLPEEDFVS
jgi:two-component system cell cycle sensor histidine kinase PleC